jgi:hypothetical protein
VNGTGSAWLSDGTRASNLGARLYGIGVASAAATVVAPIADQNVTAGSPINLNTANAFHRSSTRFPIYYAARLASGSALPTWLNFDQATGLLTGTPTDAEVGTYSIDVVAWQNIIQDAAIDHFQLTVTVPGIGGVNGTGNASESIFSTRSIRSVGHACNFIGGTLHSSSAFNELSRGGSRSAALGVERPTSSMTAAKDQALATWVCVQRDEKTDAETPRKTVSAEQLNSSFVDTSFATVEVAFAILGN